MIPPTVPEPKPDKRWLKPLLACSIGCGALVLLLVLAAGAGFWWLISPGDQRETRGIAGGGSAGVIHFDLRGDPGVRELAAKAVLEIQRAGEAARSAETPEAVRWLEELGRQQQGGAGGITMWIPREATIAFEPVPGGESDLVVAVNLAAFPRLIREVVERAAGGSGERREHRGHRYELLAGDRSLGFAGSTLLYASTPEAMERALDRLEDGPEPGPMAARLAAPGGDRWDVQGELVDHDGGLGDALAGALATIAGDPEAEADGLAAEDLDWPEWDALPDGAETAAVEAAPVEAEAPVEVEAPVEAEAPPAGAPPAVERASFGLDVVTADRLTGEIEIDCASAEDAREWLARLEGAARRLESQRGRGVLAAAVAGGVEGDRVRATIELTGISAWLERVIPEEFGPEQPPG